MVQEMQRGLFPARDRKVRGSVQDYIHAQAGEAEDAMRLSERQMSILGALSEVGPGNSAAQIAEAAWADTSEQAIAKVRRCLVGMWGKGLVVRDDMKGVRWWLRSSGSAALEIARRARR